MHSGPPTGHPERGIPSHATRAAIGGLLLLGFCAAAGAEVFPSDRKPAVYVHVHDHDTPGLDADAERLAGIEDRIDQLGRFWAENSGGKVSFWFQYIFDAAIALGPGGHRAEDWREQVHAAVAADYDFDLDHYDGMKAYDIEDTTPDADQTWSGVSYSGTGWIDLQSTRFLVLAHESGHQLGFGHAPGYVTADPTYLWDPYARAYVRYDPSSYGYVPMPFAIEENEYGHFDSVMGNRVAGHVSPRMKRSQRWLLGSTRRRFNLEPGGRDRVGDGSELRLRLFAHDQLASAVMEDDAGFPVYGVTESYDQSRFYSLSFTRTVEAYDPNEGTFADAVQEVSLEYRDNSRIQGLFISIDDALVDVNEVSQAWQLPVTLGGQFDEYTLGTSFFVGDDETFLASNPPPPTPIEAIRPARYLFEVVDANAIAGNSYVDLLIQWVDASEVPPPDFPQTLRTGRRR